MCRTRCYVVVEMLGGCSVGLDMAAKSAAVCEG